MSVVSMTGYGAASRAWTPEGRRRQRVDAEVRSVNGRFLEVKVRQPFGSAADRALRALAERYVGRGRVEISVVVREDAEADDLAPDALASLGLEPEHVARVATAVGQTQRLAAEAGLQLCAPNALELMRFCTASGGQGPDVSAAPPFLASLLDDAMRPLVRFRQEEGARLEVALRGLADRLAEVAGAIAEELPAEAERIGARVAQRMAELASRTGLASLDPARVEQEVAAVLARGDVDEELARIRSHLVQMRSTLDAEASTGQGKTLDFLTQELLREFTTMGSKLTSHEGSRRVIEAKATIERIREQVQNVE